MIFRKTGSHFSGSCSKAAATLAQRALALYVGLNIGAGNRCWRDQNASHLMVFRRVFRKSGLPVLRFRIRANLNGSIFYGKPASTLPDNAPSSVRVCLPAEPYSFTLSRSFTTFERYP